MDLKSGDVVVRETNAKRGKFNRTGRVIGLDTRHEAAYVEWNQPHRYTATTRRWEDAAKLRKVEG